MGSRCVTFGVIALTLSYWSLEVQHGTSWQITLRGSEKIYIVALHKEAIRRLPNPETELQHGGQDHTAV